VRAAPAPSSDKETSDVNAKCWDDEIMRLFVLEGYDPHPAIPFKVAV
jgi:hypothetical protein